MSSDLFSRAFWEATLERSISSAAGAVVATFGADGVFNAVDADAKTIGSMVVGAFVFSVVKALAAFKITEGSGPSLTPKAEVNANLAPFTEGSQ